MHTSTPPGRPRGVRADDTRERIAEAALQEFAHHGYSAATVTSIARRIGLSGPAVRYHFESKLALYEAVFDRTVPAVWSELRRAAIREDTLVDAVEALLRAAFDGAVSSDGARFLTTMPIEARFDPDLSHLLEKRTAIQDNIFIELAHIGIRSGELASLELAAATDLIRSIVMGVLVESYHRHDEPDHLIRSITSALHAVMST